MMLVFANILFIFKEMMLLLKSLYYCLRDCKDYIIKYFLDDFDKDYSMMMLEKFNHLRNKILSVDLPIDIIRNIKVFED